MGALGFGAELAVGRTGARRLLPRFDFTGGTLPPGAALSRGSPATRWTATGLLATEPAHSARFDHDPVSLAPLGLLIEPATTNLLVRSEAFDQAAWVASTVTVIADQASGPDGAQGADRLAATGGSSFIYQAASLNAQTSYCLSGYVRNAGAAVTLITSVLAGGGASYAIGPLSLAPGASWERFAVAGNIGAAAAPFWATLGGAGSFSTGEALLAWGLQLEAGAAATSYVASGAGSGTRAADALTLDWGGRGVADGVATIRYTFDDTTSQDVATTIAGGTATVPTMLNRRWLKRAEIL